MNKETIQKCEKLATEADKLFQEEKWDAAIEKWGEMVALLPDGKAKAAVLNNRGNAKDNMGDHEGAIADHDKAIELNPQDARAYNNRGTAKNNMGDHEGAIADYDKAIAINSQYAEAYSNRGTAKDKMGDHEGAIADYDKAMEIDPQYVAAYNNRGITKDNMGDYEGAIVDYDKALEIDPQYATAYNNRGTSKDNMGDYEGAIADYDKALEINPQDTMAYNNRGGTKNKMGDYEGAIADIDQALKIDPNYERASHNRAIALAMQASQKGRDEIEEKYQAQLRAQQEKFDRNMQEQQKKFDREQQKQLQKQQEKLNEKFEEEYQAAVDIVESMQYQENFDDYDKKTDHLGKYIWRSSCVLAGAAIVVYGSIATIPLVLWLTCEKPCEIEGTSAFSLLPFVLMGTLLLSPLVWIIRMLIRDRHKYWALREDALANLSLARIIKSNPTLRQKFSERLFDHHSNRNNANIILDSKRADTDGGIFVSIQDIAKELIKRFKPGGKGGDKSGDS